MAYEASMITIYGIKNCDTVKKALKWAEEKGLDFEFHDFKKTAVSSDVIDTWMNAVGKEVLINKRGTTYRKLGDADKEILDTEEATSLLAGQPTLMKRPIFDIGGKIVVGFKENEKIEVLSVS